MGISQENPRPKAIWMDSVKYGEAPFFVREPQPLLQVNHSTRRQYRGQIRTS